MTAAERAQPGAQRRRVLGAAGGGQQGTEQPVALDVHGGREERADLGVVQEEQRVEVRGGPVGDRLDHREAGPDQLDVPCGQGKLGGGAALRGADLCRADLCGADLCGADLPGGELGREVPGGWLRGPGLAPTVAGSSPVEAGSIGEQGLEGEGGAGGRGRLGVARRGDGRRLGGRVRDHRMGGAHDGRRAHDGRGSERGRLREVRHRRQDGRRRVRRDQRGEVRRVQRHRWQDGLRLDRGLRHRRVGRQLRQARDGGGPRRAVPGADQECSAGLHRYVSSTQENRFASGRPAPPPGLSLLTPRQRGTPELLIRRITRSPDTRPGNALLSLDRRSP
ncbi:pentapeptide repeat-containing protein [Kitasatospora sp. NPDC101155]|uniref:pentapeptide repeat-containing protein n=1 Tax=Kitasatospora sp. NPDC101155 TaxID=3364097 RepID=UPI0037FE1A55